MFQALQSAATGLQLSANRAAQAAQNVIIAAQNQSSAIGANSSDLSRGNAAYQLASQRGNPTLRLPSSGWQSSSFSSLADLPPEFQNPSKSLEEEIVNLKMATQAYKANVAVFKAIDKTTKSLLEIKV